jgi:uncharacterized protein (TIGR03382 family)
MFASLLALALAQTPSLAPAANPTLVHPTGRLALQSGVLSPPLGGDPKDAVLRYALARRDELGLHPRSTLKVGPMFSTRFGGSAHLLQTVDGLEVKGGKVIVTVDALMRVVRVASSVKPFDEIDLTENFDGPAALKLASLQIDGVLLKDDGTPYGGWRKQAFVVNGALHAGYYTFVPTLSHQQSWHVAVDATDGAVLFTENRVHNANEARVYATSPGGIGLGVGVTPTITTTLPHLGTTPGFLTGTMVDTFNCCPTENCDLSPGAPAKRAKGSMQTFGGAIVWYDVAVCDQRKLASNDPAVHASGDFVYQPVDPPTTTYVSNTSPADFDAFAEVNAYHHVSKTYDLLRTLSLGPLMAGGSFSPFTMRNPGNGKLPTLWVNASEPLFPNTRTDGGYVGNNMYRVDNAMFVAREYMEALSVPEVRTDSDLLVLYQGNAADFAYDGPVVSHEFGHGVIHSTANWDYYISIDSRSANDESGALHEGWADIIAAITNDEPEVGGYVGPRIDPTSNAIRNIDNAHVCPNVLWGESHQDSQHFTGAVWHARRTYFQGPDQGRTFDAALFAALVSFPTDVNFEKAATIVVAQVKQAFAQMADAEEKMRAVFISRGVLECSKVLDVTVDRTPREYYAISGSSLAALNPGTAIPGPYQFKIHVPDGAKSVTIRGPYFGGRGRSDGGTTTVPSASLKLLARVNTPITFTPNAAGSTLVNDADVSVIPTLPTPGQMVGTANIGVPCGGDLYFTLANTSTRDRTMQNLQFSYEPADSCPPPEPPVPPVDPVAVELPVAPEQLGNAPAGCGCTSTPLGGLMLLGLAGLFRRRKR